MPVLREKQIVGGGYRENALCPHCKSNDRERLVHLYLERETDLRSSQTNVLHVAPDTNLAAWLDACPGVEQVKGDKFTEGYHGVYPEGTRDLDVTALDFPDASFDIVLCNHVLEHVPDDAAALREIFRVLKPGGWAILQTPVSPIIKQTIEDPSVKTPKQRERYYGQFDHVRLYSRDDYLKRLAKAGFEITIFRAVEHGYGREVTRRALNVREELFIAKKPA